MSLSLLYRANLHLNLQHFFVIDPLLQTSSWFLQSAICVFLKLGSQNTPAISDPTASVDQLDNAIDNDPQNRFSSAL